MRTIRDDDSSSERPHTLEDVRALRATDKALLCLIDGEEVWVPQSQILDNSEVWRAGDEGKLIVSAWFAKQKGWE